MALGTVSTKAALLYVHLAVLPHRFFSLGTAASLAGWPEADAREALTELCESTLIEHPGNGLTWSIRDTRPARDRASAAGLGSDEYRAMLDQAIRYFLVRAVYAGRTLAGPGRARATGLTALPADIPDPFTAGDREARRQAAFQWLQDEYTSFLPAVEAAAESGFPQESWQLAEAVMPLFRLGGGSVVRWASIARCGADAARHCGRPEAEARLRLDLALACLTLEQPRQAREQADTAAGLVPASDAPALRGRLEEVRGRLLASADPADPGALDAYETAAALYAEAGERNGEARALALASGILLDTSPDRAADCATRALAITDATGDPDRIAGQALLAGGEARAALSQDRDAEALLRRATQADVPPRTTARAWEVLADLATRTGNPGMAENCLRSAVKIASDWGIDDQETVLTEKLAGLSGRSDG
jgi:tetratricopeptide (TPR) repeat protein